MPDDPTKIDLGPSLFCGDDATVISRRIFEGVVERVNEEDDLFDARLVDAEQGGEQGGEQDFAAFHLDQVGDADRPLLCPGALFWLVVEFVRVRGYPQARSGLCFRRLDDPEPAEPDDWTGRVRAAWANYAEICQETA